MTLSLVSKPSNEKCINVLKEYLNIIAPNTNKYVMMGIAGNFAHTENFYTEDMSYKIAMLFRLNVIIHGKQEHGSDHVGCECGLINREPRILFSKIKNN